MAAWDFQIHSSSSKAIELYRMAGLLTRLRSKRLPNWHVAFQWHRVCVYYAFYETYSNGTVQDSHLIPF